MARKVWTDDEIAVALAAYEANGKALRKTARDCGVPVPTLQNWLRKAKAPASTGVSSPDIQLKEKVSECLANRLEALALKLAGMIEVSAAEASTRDQAGALLIAVDKMQILRKQPNVINEVREILTAEQRVEMLSAIFSRAAQKRDDAALPSLVESGGAPN